MVTQLTVLNTSILYALIDATIQIIPPHKTVHEVGKSERVS